MIAVRILAVLSAAFLVVAFALATIWPPDTTLAALLAIGDPSWLPSLQSYVQGMASPWLWENVVVPLLARPGWLVPTGLGLVLFGGAVSLSGPRGSRTRRWRN